MRRNLSQKAKRLFDYIMIVFNFRHYHFFFFFYQSYCDVANLKFLVHILNMFKLTLLQLHLGAVIQLVFISKFKQLYLPLPHRLHSFLLEKFTFPHLQKIRRKNKH